MSITANRLAVVAAFLTSLAAGVVGVVHTFPTAWQSAAISVAGVVGAVGAALTFALGSQKFDQTPVGQAIQAKKAGVQHPLLAPAILQQVQTSSTGTTASVAVEPAQDLEAGPGDQPLTPDDPNSAEWLANRIPS